MLHAPPPSWATPRLWIQGIAYVRDDVMPAIMTMDDCIGLSMLVDRESGECIVTSSWKSAEAMRTSDLQPDARCAGVAGGDHGWSAPQVAEWEVAVMHRDHSAPAGACCRVAWMRLSSDRGRSRDRASTAHSLLPEMETLEGFCSASLLVNRDSRTRLLEDHDVRHPGGDGGRVAHQGWAIREAGVREAGVDVVDVVEYELVLAPPEACPSWCEATDGRQPTRCGWPRRGPGTPGSPGSGSRPSRISMARLMRLVGVPRAGPASTGRRNGSSASLISQVAEFQRYDGLWSTA